MDISRIEFPQITKLQNWILGLILVLTNAGLVSADSLQVDTEFWADGPVAVQPGVDRSFPAAGFGASGQVVIAWEAFGSFRNDIWLRRFNSANQAMGDPVLANVTDADDQRNPRLAVRPDGKVFAIWQSDEVDNSQTGSPIRVWIRGRLFNANLTPASSEVLISSISTNLNIDVSADVAALANGAFAVVWESSQSVGNDDQSTSIQGRLITATGQLSGSQFQINSAIAGGQRDSAISALPTAGFIAVWAGRSSGTDTGTSIQGRVYSNTGAPQGAEFQINTTIAGTQDDVDITSDGSGRLLAVWETPNATSSRTQIFARFLSATGSPTGSDFQIHATDMVNNQSEPRVSAAEAERFLVSWYSNTTQGNDPDRSVQARVVRGQSQFVGGQFQVNVGRSGDQKLPAVTGGSSRFLVVFHDSDNPFAVNDDGIVARSYDLCLFCDTFESGSVGGWSSSAP